ncbi:hypothetical protein ACENI8_001023, partial [Neisseria gonorrhoeae]
MAHRSKPDIIRLSTSVKIVLFSQLTLNFGAENESSPQKTFSSLLFSSLLFPSAAQAASEDNGRGPYVQADLA